VVAAYAAISGAALAFPGRPGEWPLLALVHAGVVLGALRAPPLRAPLAWFSSRYPRTAAFLADWYPLLLMPIAYRELATLNVAVWGGHYFDAQIMAIEEAVFGGQPAATLAYQLPSLVLSEILHLAYLAYYALIYVPFAVLYARRRDAEFRIMLLALVIGFAVHYLVFVYFPVQGPRYIFPPPAGPPAAGAVYAAAHTVLEAGSSRGAAFPSSHAAIAVIQAVAVSRLMGRTAAVVASVTAGLLCLGAVYGGFHYGVDVIIGAAIGLAIGLSTVRRPARAR
jgi:membrane-associated phospholipid phosphatase